MLEKSDGIGSCGYPPLETERTAGSDPQLGSAEGGNVTGLTRDEERELYYGSFEKWSRDALLKLSTIKFLTSAVAIAEAFPTFEQQFRYKQLLDMAKVIGERTPERTRSQIEAQAALAGLALEVQLARVGKDRPTWDIGELATNR